MRRLGEEEARVCLTKGGFEFKQRLTQRWQQRWKRVRYKTLNFFSFKVRLRIC